MKCISCILLCVTVVSCSKVDEELLVVQPDFSTLTPTTVDTKLPVLDIIVNQVQFDEMFTHYNTPVEVEAELFLYRDQQLKMNGEEIEVEIKGSHTAQFPIKSLGIKFEDSYDNSDRSLLHPHAVLPFHNIDHIKAFRLRNSGNDLYKTMVKDLVYTQMAIDAGLDIDLAYGEQAMVFVNHSFYGLMNLRSEANTKGIAKLYQTESEEVDLAKIVNPGEIVYKSGDETRLQAYIDAIQSGNLAYVKMNTDIPHFIDYVIYQSFIANYDWPYNNVRFYSIHDQPFRFAMYDLDWCNTVYMDEDPMFFIDPEKENLVTDLFLLLYEYDPAFKDQFDLRYEAIPGLPELSPEHFNAVVHYYTGTIDREMAYQVEKYGAPSSLVDWYRETDLLKLHYKKRFDHFR